MDLVWDGLESSLSWVKPTLEIIFQYYMYGWQIVLYVRVEFLSLKDHFCVEGVPIEFHIRTKKKIIKK